jgi:hypothetical protein
MSRKDCALVKRLQERYLHTRCSFDGALCMSIMINFNVSVQLALKRYYNVYEKSIKVILLS